MNDGNAHTIIKEFHERLSHRIDIHEKCESEGDALVKMKFQLMNPRAKSVMYLLDSLAEKVPTLEPGQRMHIYRFGKELQAECRALVSFS
jgi:hypothetical protein